MRTPLALVLVAPLAACTADIYMTDDIDLTWDFELTPRRFEGDLHTPYVKGAPVTLYVDSSDEDEDLSGWTIVSSDASVFRIDRISVDPDRHGISATGQAVGEGTAGLVVIDREGNRVGARAAEVLAPGNARLEAHGYLLLDRQGEAPVDEIRIVQGGTATYLVKYFRDGRELHGNSVLGAGSTPSLNATARTSFLFENREWIAIESTTVGTNSVTLTSDGAPVASIPVVTVPETDITQVALATESERGAEMDEWLVLLAQASDSINRRIFGVDFAWEIDGVMQTEAGDLYRYKFSAGQYVDVSAERSGHTATARIQSSGGYVDSTNNVGCNAGGARGLGSLGIALAAAMFGPLVRRRRRVTDED
jgi:hypothetical protein